MSEIITRGNKNKSVRVNFSDRKLDLDPRKIPINLVQYFCLLGAGGENEKCRILSIFDVFNSRRTTLQLLWNGRVGAVGSSRVF